MRQVHSIDLDTFRARDTFFTNNADVIEKSALVKEDVNGYRALFNALESRLDADKIMNMTGLQIQAFKRRISDNTRKGLDVLMAHSIKTKDAVLKNSCKTPVSTFYNASELDFVKMIRTEVVRFDNYTELLDKYGLNEAFRTQLGKDIELYPKLRPQLAVDRSKSMVMTSDRKDGFDELNEYIDKVLDVAIATLDDSDEAFATFKKEYAAVSTGRTPTVSPTRVSLTVIDAVTELPLQYVVVEAPELKISDKTDENGKFVMKVGSKKELLICLSLEGYVTQEITVKKIIRGRVINVEVRMVLVAKTA